MLDSIDIFKKVASANGLDIDLARPLNQSTDEEAGDDRKIISEFMSHAFRVQELLNICERSNTEMKKIADKQIHDNMSANQESKSNNPIRIKERRLIYLYCSKNNAAGQDY